MMPSSDVQSSRRDETGIVVGSPQLKLRAIFERPGGAIFQCAAVWEPTLCWLAIRVNLRLLEVRFVPRGSGFFQMY